MVINENSDLELSHAIEFHRQGNSSAALKVYQALLERDSTNPDLLHFYGVFCFQFGDQGQGIQLVESCLKLNPQYPDACNNLGNMYKLQGKWEEAQAQYERVLALRPEFSDAMINLGVLARSRQDYNQALQWYKRAIEANPKDGLAYDNLSRLYLKLGHKRSALEVLDAAVQEAVREESSREDMHLRRAYLMMVLGHTEQGQQIYEDWLKAYPESKRAQHMLAAVTGENVPDKSDPDYVKAMFDRFSENFDEILDQLDYKAPQIVGDLVARYYPDTKSALNVLDAGCGTGLCGDYLCNLPGSLTGVDLSPGMLARARQREHYDELIETELVAYLKESRRKYDVIVSADTLNYFGELSDVFIAAVAALKPGGRFFFTLEQHENNSESDFVLNTHGRYSHAIPYVEKLLESSGFGLDALEDVVLRMEVGIPVKGIVVAGIVP